MEKSAGWKIMGGKNRSVKGQYSQTGTEDHPTGGGVECQTVVTSRQNHNKLRKGRPMEASDRTKFRGDGAQF